jgi:hypothetical protein
MAGNHVEIQIDKYINSILNIHSKTILYAKEKSNCTVNK